jgi:hypothetical protein
MPKRSLALAVLAVIVSGCGTTSTAQPSPSAATTSQGLGQNQRIELAKADCMKANGFKYVAWIPPAPPDTDQSRMASSRDYEGMKSYRAKYGFGVSAMLVYPPNGETAGQAHEPTNPNVALVKALSPAQRHSYGIKFEKCQITAIKQITGKDVKSADDWSRFRDQAYVERRKRELNGDARLTELATGMADCMTAKGYQVTSHSPIAMRDWGYTTFTRELHELAKKEDKSIPDFDPESGTGYIPAHLTEGEKRAILNREIKAALDDLECGKDFHPAAAAKDDQLSTEPTE